MKKRNWHGQCGWTTLTADEYTCMGMDNVAGLPVPLQLMNKLYGHEQGRQ